jgi:CRISP-associated protein Cas1
VTDLGPLEIPDAIPARMVNEFAYCRRLFFLEWVQGRFEDNPDTVEGRFHHRAIDVEKGRAPAAEEADELRSARSVMVGSERLGLIARIDILEGRDGAVVPVDAKRGRPPMHGPAWEPEMVQLCVAGLILRDQGYRCDEGQLFFVETRERRTIPFDDHLVALTVQLIQELRVVAQSDVPPAPLVDSPKCPRCSLVGICLPDETNALAGRSERAPRRLTPRDDAARPVYVTEQGAVLGLSGGRLQVRKERQTLHEVRLIDVSQVNVYGNAQITSGLHAELFSRQVPVLWFSHGGWFRGMASGLPSKHVELRRRQVIGAAQGGLAIAQRVVAGKIRNSRVLLMRNTDPKPADAIAGLKELAVDALAAQSTATLLGIEGAAARTYFQHFSLMLRPAVKVPGGGFDFDGRNRRPPADGVNCLLSYLYGLLVKDLTVVTTAVGFDPYIGFYHRPRFGRPALALDLAEEFRSVVADSVVLTLINNGEVKPSDFVVRAGGVALTSGGRKAVLAAYERRLDTEVTHPTFGYRVTYRRVMEVQARLLGAHLLGEVPDYVAFTTT